MATKRVHKKPIVPKEALEAEKVARTMYDALTQKGAPKATPTGYIMGACQVLKLLVKQAVEQGGDMEGIKMFVYQFVHKEI